MNVLVTGGLGFVGRAVALDLVTARHSVDVLSRRTGVDPPTSTRLVSADLRDRGAVSDVIVAGRYDAVCHLAGLTRGRESMTDPLTYWDVNLNGTLNLLIALATQAPHQEPRPRVVFASTQIVYGTQHTGALREDLPVQPASPYASSKAAAEQLIRDLAATSAITATILRLFNVAGSVAGHTDTDPTRIIPNVLRAARGELPHVSVNGDGSAVREFAHVRDAARAFRLAMEAETAGADVYNVGTGHGVSVAELISVAEKVTARNIPVVHLPAQPEPHTLIADISAITKRLGWRPTESNIENIITSAWHQL